VLRNLAAVAVLAITLAAAALAPASTRAPLPDALTVVRQLHASARSIESAAPPPPLLDRRPAGPPDTAFYVNAASGSDAAVGTSPTTAWRTLARASQQRYRGGDRLLLHGRFLGTLELGHASLVAASRRDPLTIGSYGSGRALIAPDRGSGIVALNVAGIRISGLELAGRRAGCRQPEDGILFDASNAGRLADGITIDHVDVHGFCDGIAIGSEDDGSIIEHVRITAVSSHDNVQRGIATYDPALKHHDVRDVIVRDSRAYRNREQGGIVLFGVEHARVEHSEAYENGRDASGAVGIWAFDADHVVFEHDESYRNLTADDDGDGFDLDAGVTNSVMQYDYSHNNAGIGFLICACVVWYQQHNDVIRRDVSAQDGSSGQPSGIYVGGGEPLHGVDVVANTIYSSAGKGPLIQLDGAGSIDRSVRMYDNLFVAGARKALLDADTVDSVGTVIEGNDWWSRSGRFRVLWGGMRFDSLGSWRAATGVETNHGRPIGLSADPHVCALGAAPTLFPEGPGTLSAYRLRADSPLIGAGLDTRRRFGVSGGAYDFSGGAARYRNRSDIGAEERQPGERC
jgi:Right handed beta helix region